MSRVHGICADDFSLPSVTDGIFGFYFPVDGIEMCLDRFIDFGSWPSLGRQLTLPPVKKSPTGYYIYIYILADV